MLEVRDIKKVYIANNGEKVEALKNVSIDFIDRGMVFLLGKSGSGKSTLLHILGGLDRPDSGDLIIEGRSSSAFKEKDFDFYRNNFVGFVFQELNLIRELNVRENLLLALKLQGKDCATEELKDVLDKVGMGEYLYRNVSDLSGGQRQRVAIARALIKNPRLILADEPSGALDSETARGVFDFLKELSKNRLVVVASHDRESAEKYGDRIIELKDGEIVKDSNKANASPADGCVHEWAGARAIKSRLPLSFAAKIAFSNFKKKKFKLVSSILLSSIAFSLFGGAASLGFINQNEVMAKALKSSYLSSAKIIKNTDYAETHKAVFDAHGEAIYEFKTDESGSKRTLFSNKELEALNSRYASVAGVFRVPDSWGVGDNRYISVPEPLDIFYAAGNDYLFSGFSDCGATYCDSHFKLEKGGYPEKSNEIAISSHKAEAFLASVDNEGNKLFNSLDDLIGSPIVLSESQGLKSREVTVSGVYKTEDIPEKFEAIKSDSGRKNYELREEYFAFKANSFLDIAFVSGDFFDANIGLYDRDRTMSKGADTRSSVMLEREYDRDSSGLYFVDSAIPSSFISKHPSVFDVRDLDGNRFADLKLLDDQIIISEHYKNSVSAERYADLCDYLSPFSSVLYTHFWNPLMFYSDDVYSLFESDDFIAKEAAFKTIVNEGNDEIGSPENEAIYEYLDDIVDAYFDEMSKRDFLASTAYKHRYEGGAFIEKLLVDHLTSSELDDYRALSSRIASWGRDEPLSFAQNEWNRLESLIADHYSDIHAAYEALSHFDAFMPYPRAQSIFKNADNVSTELAIAKRLNDKYDGDYEALCADFIAGGLSDDDLADMVRCLVRSSDSRQTLSNYQYGQFEKRIHLSKNINLQKDGKTFEVIGTVSSGADSLDGVIIANPATLSRLGVEIKEDSSIVFDVMEYEYTNEGKYDYLLTVAPKEDGVVELLNASFDTYFYRMDDLVSRQVRLAVENSSLSRTVLALAGLVLVILSAFLLSSFINDSVRDKEKEIGILKSMGATRKDIINIFSIEVLVISLPVAILGNVFGWLLVLFGNATYSIEAFTVPLFNYSVLTVIMVAVLAILISFLSAILPIKKISRKNAVDAIKG